MSDRLKELQRQRALLQEHAAWLEQEIARETGAMPAVASLLDPKPKSEADSAPAPVTPMMDPAAEIINRYNREAPNTMAADAKRGCILYFIFGMGLLALSALGAYVVYQQLHPQ